MSGPEAVYRDKVAIVTGAASGIGRALVEELSRRGAIVIASDRNSAPLEETVRACAGSPCRPSASPLDVTDLEGFKALVEETSARHGRLDYLFNNAGVAVGGEARDLAVSDWKEVLDVNLMGVINGVLAAYPVMVRQRSGHIVNTASVAGLVPLPCEVSYVASKYGVVGLSHALRAEAADLGVKVTVVCPGKIETPMWRTSKIVAFDRDRLLSLVPKGIEPRECAAAILAGVARNRSTVVVPGHARLMWYAGRLSSDLAILLARRFMRRVRAFRVEK